MSVLELLDLSNQRLEAGDWSAAETGYRAILSADPACGAAWRGLALLAEALGALPQASEWMALALQHLPDSDKMLAHRDLSRLAVAQGLGHKAAYHAVYASNGLGAVGATGELLACLRLARTIVPDEPTLRQVLHHWLVNIMLGLIHSDPDQALALGEEAFAINPDHEALLGSLAGLYALKGDQERRRAVLDCLVALFDRQTPPSPSRAGVLDVAATEVDAETIANGLLSDGVVVLRGLLDAAAVDHFLSLTEQRWLRDESLVLPHIRPQVLAAMSLLYGRPIRVMTSASNVRTASLSDDQSYLYYHQDLTPLATMGINFWAALDPIDGTRPGLEVLARRQHHAFGVEPGHMRDVAPYRIPDASVRGVYPASDFIAPRMNVGDGMLFLFSTVHSSFWTPDMIANRRNAELRFY